MKKPLKRLHQQIVRSPRPFNRQVITLCRQLHGVIPMSFKDVAEVIEARTVKSANDLLSKGWTLLSVSTSGDKDGSHGPCYVLGRDKGTPALEGKVRPKIPAMARG